MKSYTDIEQSKKLAEILPLDSADMTYSAITEGMREKMTIQDWKVNVGLDVSIKENLFSYRNGYMIPCWSLAALLSVLRSPDLIQNSEGTWIIRVWGEKFPWSVGGFDNPIDACYEMILRLHELNLLKL